jgi:hypothetical protein
MLTLKQGNSNLGLRAQYQSYELQSYDIYSLYFVASSVSHMELD